MYGIDDRSAVASLGCTHLLDNIDPKTRRSPE
jgi:hypothetical protein